MIRFGMDNYWMWIGQPLDVDWTTMRFRLDNQEISNFHGGEDNFGTLPDDIWAANL